ncbi:hypothetical protein CPC16_010599 [Podila verticillata]|nr:hypothetical protein BGZ59_009136 [Podila verticillata]KAF9394684.1 hypothetical protein CPC16_010599 [Podila verticillata]KAI9239270.1 MAG: pre-mRNA processing factor 3-domain-containing protein [Podila humilis]KFH64406.1 hypothetical protein MVEG_10231 [Podila verticillata NRRL 6337]
MTPEEIKAQVAKAKAEVLAKAQAMAAARAAAASGSTPIAGAPMPAAGVPNMDAIRQRAEALKARMASLSKVPAAGSTAPVPRAAPVPTAPAPADPRARGGLGVDVSSMISRDEAGNLIITAPTGKGAPAFATAKVNQKAEPKKKLEILEVPEDYTDVTKNPYYDPNLGSGMAAPRERRPRPLKMAPKGKFTAIANQIRAEERMEQLRKEIEESGQANIKEEDLQLKDGFQKRDILKEGVEWWDAAFLPNKTYNDIKDGHAKIETEDSLITHYVQHPVPIEPPNERANAAAAAKPRPLMLTTKERKKLRRQRRRELLKEKQDKIRLGLLAPDAPKVKLANMMRVLGQEAVLNPTEIEMRVRQQMAERLQTHLDANAERKLTVEERKTKEQKKKEEDLNNGIHVSVYKINDLSHPQKRFKVDTNAQQYGLTGIVLMHPIFSIVVVEGGGKAIRQYKKLMLRRIDWTDNTRLDGTEVSETTDNKCLLVWEGQLRERQFKQLKFIKARTDAHLKETLARFGVQHYWDLALGFKEDEMLGAEAGL